MTTATQSLNLDPNAISKRAYEIWESLGRPEGVADQTWAEAVRQLSNDAAQAKPKATSAAPIEARVETPTVEARVERAAPVEARAESDAPSSDPPSSPNVTSSEKKNNANNHRRSARR